GGDKATPDSNRGAREAGVTASQSQPVPRRPLPQAQGGHVPPQETPSPSPRTQPASGVSSLRARHTWPREPHSCSQGTQSHKRSSANSWAGCGRPSAGESARSRRPVPSRAGAAPRGPGAPGPSARGSAGEPFAAGLPSPTPRPFAHDAQLHTGGRGRIKRRARGAAAGAHGLRGPGLQGAGRARRGRERRREAAGGRAASGALPAGGCALRGGPPATPRAHGTRRRRAAARTPRGRPGPHGAHGEAAPGGHQVRNPKGPASHLEPKKERARRQLYVASAICLVFMIGEIVGGYLAHSLAIMTDAAHLLTDFASMLVSLFSLWMSSRPATKTMNFGWQRAEILGALLSVLSIWVVTGVLVFLAVERLISGDYEIEGGTMLITSGCAVAVNIIMGLTLHQSSHGHSHDSSQQQENPSVRAAFIHVIGDFLQSVGILVAAYILYFKPEYKYVDPICTFLFSILVLGTTLTILRDVIVVLMEGNLGLGLSFVLNSTTLTSLAGSAGGGRREVPAHWQGAMVWSLAQAGKPPGAPGQSWHGAGALRCGCS
uniref:Proton-coupled zinc antiporter SLC30A2 n=1 Tax=Canis lupus familiaris TaxID=9615 RepID=A0A8C0Q780_CANLF